MSIEKRQYFSELRQDMAACSYQDMTRHLAENVRQLAKASKPEESKKAEKEFQTFRWAQTWQLAQNSCCLAGWWYYVAGRQAKAAKRSQKIVKSVNVNGQTVKINVFASKGSEIYALQVVQAVASQVFLHN